MVDRKVLKIAQQLGWDCYLECKNLRDSIPWGESTQNLPYRNQMIASYNEAKAMFEAEVIICIKPQKNKK